MKTTPFHLLTVLFTSIAGFGIAGQALAGSQLMATCQSKDDKDIALCVYQEPWGATDYQYVTYWAKGTNCHGIQSSDRDYTGKSHQFIRDDIKSVDDDGSMKLKETSNILGVFCREKHLFKMNDDGDATFIVKNSGCTGLFFGDGPQFTPPKSKLKTKMKCTLSK